MGVDSMKLTLLGTAAIGYPLAFCNCENCQTARIKRGKSIRKRASLLINDDLLVDLGPDTQTAMSMYNKDMGKIKYLLQTHIHTDHCDIGLLTTRITYLTKQKKQNLLELYAHPKCLNIISKKIEEYENVKLSTKEGQEKLFMKCIEINANEIKEFGNYKIKAIESNHDKINGSLLYVVESNGKSIFYATDTSELSDDALKQLSTYKLDVVIMDHTFGDTEYSYSHLNEKIFIEQINKMKSLNIIDKNTKIYGTHISHEGMPYHELSEELANKNGYNIAYDGLEIEL